jgi:regulatory protein
VAGRRSGRASTGPAASTGSPAAAQLTGSTSFPLGSGGLAGASQAARAGSDPASGPDADPEAIARQICLRMLTTAPRTQAQLAAALRRRGVPEEAATAVLARFAEVKLIDDATFARAWVESRHHGRGLAGRALGAELRQRGVGQEDIQAALGELDPEQELATARQLVARRLPGTAGMAVPARMRRLTGVLARKGYPPGLAYRVIREALEQEAGDGRVPFDDLEVPPEPNDSDEAAGA